MNPAVRQSIAVIAAAVILVGLVIRMVYALAIPLRCAPDEEGHITYVKYIATTHRLPQNPVILNQSDWNKYSEYHQPPLYYMLMAPVYAAFDHFFHNENTTFRLLRICNLLLWMLTVWCLCTFLLNRIGNGALKMIILSMFCLLPTWCYGSAMVNNDNLAVLEGCVIVAVFARKNRTNLHALLAGVLLGAALVTKITTVGIFFIIGPFIVIEGVRHHRSWRRVVLFLAITCGTAFLVWLPWFYRSETVFGNFSSQYLVSPYQWKSVFYKYASGIGYPLRTFWSVSGHTNRFYGIFPYFGVVATAVAALGIVRIFAGGRKYLEQFSLDRIWKVSLAAVLVQILLTVRINLLYACGQGRHLYPVLFPIALWFGLGLLSFGRIRTWATPHKIGFLFVVYSLAFFIFTMKHILTLPASDLF